jgi:hypothetical protein
MEKKEGRLTMGLIVMFVAGFVMGVIFMAEVNKDADAKSKIKDAEIIKLQAEIDKLKENK